MIFTPWSIQESKATSEGLEYKYHLGKGQESMAKESVSKVSVRTLLDHRSMSLRIFNPGD